MCRFQQFVTSIRAQGLRIKGLKRGLGINNSIFMPVARLQRNAVFQRQIALFFLHKGARSGAIDTTSQYGWLARGTGGAHTQECALQTGALCLTLEKLAMKKFLVALATLAASTAFAQSSVTLYGVADAWFGQTSQTFGTAAAVKQIKIDSGGYNGSRWGLRGSEDLGGGLKANFQIESGFGIDTGASAQGALFGRQAYVGLSGGFGAINFGRQYTAYDDARGAENANNGFDTAFTPVGTVYTAGSTSTVGVLGGVKDYDSRVNNSIKYSSPVFGGVSGALTYALGEDKPATGGGSAGSNVAGHVKYVNGPLGVFAAFQNEKPAGVNTTATKFANLGANYDFGFVRLSAGYQNAKVGSLKDDEFQVGVAVPFGAAAVSAGFASTKTKANGTEIGKGTGFGLTGYYDLSKRTAAYAGVRSSEFENAAGTTTSKDSLFAVGVRHRF
jgi:predicted porin